MSTSTGTDGGKQPRRVFLNSAPTDLPAGAPMDARKIEFGRRVQARMNAKQWNQTDLARESSKQMPGSWKGKNKITRDNVSKYVRGLQFPGPVRLKALCAALGVQQADLLPVGIAQSVDDRAPPFAVKAMDGGRVWLQINQTTDHTTAMKIIAMLQSDEK